MKIYINSKRKGINSIAELNTTTKEVKVLKGSIVSEDINYSEKFKGAKTIEKYRNGKIKNNILQEDMIFKSFSTAANFVTGRSTNGLIAWKDENGKKIKDIIKK
ncbi:MAG: DUF4357 domain-containing protein [Clostridia bacterium]|nr:DUF4357 domain-containing protein [Clostridia bacterium]